MMKKYTNNPLEELIALEKQAIDFGFSWPNDRMIHESVIHESDEVLSAIQKGEGEDRIQEEIGDLIQVAISWCIFAGYDVHGTLEKTTRKFRGRMDALKALAQRRGLDDVKGEPLAVLEELWQKAKKIAERSKKPC